MGYIPQLQSTNAKHQRPTQREPISCGRLLTNILLALALCTKSSCKSGFLRQHHGQKPSHTEILLSQKSPKMPGACELCASHSSRVALESGTNHKVEFPGKSLQHGDKVPHFWDGAPGPATNNWMTQSASEELTLAKSSNFHSACLPAR